MLEASNTGVPACTACVLSSARHDRPPRAFGHQDKEHGSAGARVPRHGLFATELFFLKHHRDRQALIGKRNFASAPEIRRENPTSGPLGWGDYPRNILTCIIKRCTFIFLKEQ